MPIGRFFHSHVAHPFPSARVTIVTRSVNSCVGLDPPIEFRWGSKLMNAKRTHIVLSDQLVKEIDALVGRRHRSSFLNEAAEKELMRRRQIQALKAAAGAWKDEDHPELKQGSAKWVQGLREESERRFKRVTAL